MRALGRPIASAVPDRRATDDESKARPNVVTAPGFEFDDDELQPDWDRTPGAPAAPDRRNNRGRVTSMQKVADISFHLTPRTLALELEKLERRLPILLHHLKPPCVEQIRIEVQALNNPDIHYLEDGKTYRL